MGAAANERRALENDLRRAIGLDELELHYQPIIDAKSLKICGAEALVRWRHPTKGLIPPDQFIPLAEDTGLISAIDAWVLKRACADAARWPAHVKVAVNLSPVQFRTTNPTDVVMSALARSGLPPARLELEITETALIESASECLVALHGFKKAGISIALDDFGTGYSSLSQLTTFPFDKIKIDKSFTQNLTKRAECAAVVSAALTLAQNLSIATTAEGVETLDQYQLLRLAGVTSVQGYLFKRPSPLAELDFGDAFGGLALAGAA
jgi:EAL domain-containing protein (putative c-di-GMP-specific phosphodiesterase class I)